MPRAEPLDSADQASCLSESCCCERFMPSASSPTPCGGLPYVERIALDLSRKTLCLLCFLTLAVACLSTQPVLSSKPVHQRMLPLYHTMHAACCIINIYIIRLHSTYSLECLRSFG